MSNNVIKLCIAGIHIEFINNSDKIQFDTKSTALSYRITNPSQDSDYLIKYNFSNKTYPLSNYTEVFSGNLTTDEFLKYKWHILNNDKSIVIKLDYDNHPHIDEIVAIKDNDTNIFDTYIKVHKSDTLILDPYLHPFGSLFTLYILHWHKALLIHASCIINNNEAYAFTGVSGIGKSTMAKLWQQCGHTIINDDRLAIRLKDKCVNIYNTPMPYYTQEALKSKLTKIFILKQHPSNYIKQLHGINAFTKVLSNCIQQFHSPEMIKKHLNILEQILHSVKVYEVGFKPDTEIVQCIKEMK